MPHPTNTRAVTAAVMMATFLTALDITVVGTAMPTIIGALGGLALYSWVFSSYLLTSTTTVPVYGRLADMYGRKPVFIFGALLFLGGSALCGASTNMEQLILFRAIQGLGAGAVLPVSITVIGDIYSVQQRARVQGLLSAVWGISAIVGPAAGGLIVDHVGWRWVFYVNLPFGILSILLFILFLQERIAHQRRSIDYLGAVTLTVAVSLLMVGLLELGESGNGLPVSSLGMLIAAVLLLALFLWHETRTAEPLLPITLFSNRVVSVSNGANFLLGATLMGFDSYVPPFVQGVLGGTAVSAGATLAPMSIGWPIGSTLSGRLILRHGYRPVVLLGTGLILAGSLLMVVVGGGTSQPFIMAAMVVTGLGMGFGATSFLVAVQSSVGWGERGVATASVQFFRSIGSAIGVAIMGAIMNDGLSQGLRSVYGGGNSAAAAVSSASVILDPTARASLPPGTLEAIRVAFASSLHSVFLSIAVVSAIGLALAFLFPRVRAEVQTQSKSSKF